LHLHITAKASLQFSLRYQRKGIAGFRGEEFSSPQSVNGYR